MCACILSKGNHVNIREPGHGNRSPLWCPKAVTQANSEMPMQVLGRVIFSFQGTDSMESGQPEIWTLFPQNATALVASSALAWVLENPRALI
jgi:hypothetical protein